MVLQDFPAFVFLYFILNTSFPNSTMATALLNSTTTVFFVAQPARKAMGGLAHLDWQSCYRYGSLASRGDCLVHLSFLCPKMEATTYKDTYTAGAAGVH